MRDSKRLVIFVLALACFDSRAADELLPSSVQKLSVEQPEIRLTLPRARQQLLVTALAGDGYLHDVTRTVTIEPLDPAIVRVEPSGIIRPRQAGTTKVRITGFGRTTETTVIVTEPNKSAPVSFVNEVMGVLGKAGCNAGACHGHASGKGGFKLSLRGYDPAADHAALRKRLDLKDPEQSQILLKPTEQDPHRGGKRFEKGSDAYEVIRQWVTEGANADVGRAVRLQKIEVLPVFRLMPKTHMKQQLAVIAHYADGTSRDVTDRAIFELSAEGIVEVGPDGLVVGKREGEAAILVRFLGQMALSRFLVIRHSPDFRWTEQPVNNFVDRHVHAKLKAIQILPSALASDVEFLRRVSLDVAGLPPTPAEVHAFWADLRSDKRERKIDELLEQEAFGDVWAAYWLELSGTTATGDSAGRKGVMTLYNWLSRSINENVPYDRFVKSLLASKGGSLQNPAITFSVNRLPRAEVVPQLFLGVRLECAQCHDHPFDIWKQADYQSLQTFFTDLSTKEGAGDPGGREIHSFVPPERYLPWEQGKKTTLRLLDGKSIEVPVQQDRREVLADWLFEAAKTQVARAIANRVWGKLLGRGIVEPVDDMRFSNPPVNEPLLAELAADFIAHKYDFKHLTRTILNSRAYQTSSIPNASNAREQMNFSHARLRRLSAEQLLDSISQVTGVDEEQRVAPPGARSIQIPFSYTGSRFLTMFGRPEQRMSACECIRSQEITLPQILHLLNGETIGRKLRDKDGTLQRLLNAKTTDDRLVEELYLTVLSRLPTERERQRGTGLLHAGSDRAEAAEDLMWALLVSQEFLFNH